MPQAGGRILAIANFAFVSDCQVLANCEVFRSASGHASQAEPAASRALPWRYFASNTALRDQPCDFSTALADESSHACNFQRQKSPEPVHSL
jgi:hypothetical protein